MKKLTWNVFYYDINRKFISQFNIFDHASFRRSVEKNLSRCTDKATFEKELKRDAMYYFWSRFEWEIAISPLTDISEKAAQKIDVYRQIENNWPVFLNYVWNFKGRVSHQGVC